MVSLPSLGAVLTTIRRTAYAPALLALVAAVVGVTLGVLQDDVATALGALLFVPSALLLFGIGSRTHGRDGVSSH
jgi:hypothetical protein